MENLHKKTGIYMIQNVVTKDCYIGSSINLKGRWAKHSALLNHNHHENPFLQSSFNKYGKENFTYTVMEFCGEEELRIREQYYVDKLNPMFNLIKDVERHVLSEESRAKVINTLKEGYASGRIVSQSKKAVKKFSLDGEFIKEYDSLRDACEDVGIVTSTLIRCLKGVYNTAGGFVWRYSTESSPTGITRRKMERAIYFEDKDTKERIHFRSVKEAAVYFNVNAWVLPQYVWKKHCFRKQYYVYHALL